MPNPIKYNASTETLALKKGNFWIGTGDVGKGPTNVTGYYNGITPPAGGFTIYLNKETSGPSIYTVSTEAQLVSLTNTIGAQSFTTSGQCLNWFATQTDKMIFNIDYPAIVTDGLVLNLDAGFAPSYPTTGTTWYDVSSGGNNGTLTNGPTFDSANSGSIVFDGADDFIDVTNSGLDISGNFTSEAWVNTDNYSTYRTIISWGVHATNQDRSMWLESGTGKLCLYFYPTNPNMAIGTSNVADGNWHHCVATWDGTTGRIYVDGVLENSLALTAGAYTYANTYIGKNVANAYRFAGDISLGKIYDKALTPSEVLENYNATKGRFGL